MDKGQRCKDKGCEVRTGSVCIMNLEEGILVEGEGEGRRTKVGHRGRGGRSGYL